MILLNHSACQSLFSQHLIPTDHPLCSILFLLSSEDKRNSHHGTKMMSAFSCDVKLTHSVGLSGGAVSCALLCEHYSVLSTSAEFWINAGVLTGAEFQSTERTHSCASALPSRQNEHEVDPESHQTEFGEAIKPQ